ncbi:STAS domain-containing protein [Pelotomaculum schinkii]|nr:STAS domain-containing protein [Pelotomaculum schinkii]
MQLTTAVFKVVNIVRRLDTVTAPDYDKQCAVWIDEGNKKFVFDFAKLEYISSAGQRSILVIVKKLRACGGYMALCNLNGLVQEVISISGFDSFLSINGVLDETIAKKMIGMYAARVAAEMETSS